MQGTATVRRLGAGGACRREAEMNDIATGFCPPNRQSLTTHILGGRSFPFYTNRTVTPFEHLTVLVPIVIGLGIGHLLTTVHELVHVRARGRVYWLPIVWFGLIFVSLIEWWWAIFSLRTTVTWHFFYFLCLLMSPVTMYLAAAFVLPDDSERGNDVIDLRRYYNHNNAWLFGVQPSSLQRLAQCCLEASSREHLASLTHRKRRATRSHASQRAA